MTQRETETHLETTEQDIIDTQRHIRMGSKRHTNTHKHNPEIELEIPLLRTVSVISIQKVTCK